MEQVTANVRTDTGIRGCNPSYVTTADGVVVIDTPQLPTQGGRHARGGRRRMARSATW